MEKLVTKFYEIFGNKNASARKFLSPARINLIGEHTDYNGGFVFPCALDFGTFGVARRRDDDKIILKSMLFEKKITVSLSDLDYKDEHNWANYVKGVVVEFLNAGYKLGGFELLIDSNMPLSSGLSSSASLEVLVSKILSDLFDLNVSRVDMALLSQKAENNYMNLKCGIMDQFIIANGETGKAMLLNCDTLNYEQHTLNLGKYKILICNTKKPRNLVESKYNERLSECQEGLNILKKYIDISCLADLSIENFNQFKDKIENETIRKRVEHVVTETKRTTDSAKAMENGDLVSLGNFITASHNSLRDLYDVTGVELDTIVASALKQEGVLGSRMTGAGFGGCAIALVEENKVNDFIKNVSEEYTKAVNLTAEFYIANIGNGVIEIK